MQEKLAKTYRALRAKHGYLNAQSALQWARSELREHDRYFTSAFDHSVPAPGIGRLELELPYDEDYDYWDECGVEHKWSRSYRDMNKQYRVAYENCGAHVGDGWYATGIIERDGALMVRFDDDVAELRKYHRARGYSRSDAELLARESIRKQCDYYRRVGQGDLSAVGVVVRLYDDDDNLIDEDSVWGVTTFGDREGNEHILGIANDFARDLIAKYDEQLQASIKAELQRQHEIELNYAGM